MAFGPLKNQLQKYKKYVAGLMVFVFSFSLTPVSFAVDADGDGLQSESDNTDLIDIFTPHIPSPAERARIIDADLEATFSGDGEVGTQMRVFEGGSTMCTTDVSGNGVSVGTTASAIIDSTTLLPSEEVFAQFFYDTGTDSASTAWRTDTNKSWYGSADFPAKAILMASDTNLLVFNAETRSPIYSFAEAGITSIFALNGKAYLGKSSGLKIYDFASDDFTEVLTTVSTPAITNNSVTALDGKTVSAKDYIAIGTAGGTSLFNATDDTIVSKVTAEVQDAAIDTDNKVRYVLASTSFVSDEDVAEPLSGNWAVTDISTSTNFASGTGQAANGDLIGHSSGVTHTQSLRTDIEEGLIYKETFNSEATIEANPYATATVTSATATTGRTSSDSAFDFNGTTSTIPTAITDNTQFKTGNGFTLSAWIKPDSTGENNGRVIDKSFGTVAENGFRFEVNNNLMRFNVNGPAGSSISSATNSITYGVWTHVLVTVASNATITHYINGVVSGTPGTTGNISGITTANPLTIGNRSTAIDRTFDGAISDVKIYNRVLTSTEITNLAADGALTHSYRQITKDAATPAFTGDELGYWPESVTDRSDASNNLTNNNAATVSAVASGAELQQFTFNGTSNYLNSSSTDFNVTGDELTVGMWVKRPTTGGTGSYQQILSHGTSRDTRSYFLSAGDEFFDYPLAYDPYFFGVKTSNGFKAASVQTTPAAATWEFIVGTYDGANVRIYRNGVLEEVNPHTGNITSVAEDLRMGWGYESGYFSGNVAMPFISANALTTEQILAYYNMTANWFAANATLSLFGTSNSVTDISQHPLRNLAYISTTDGVTKLDTSTGRTTQISTGVNVANMAVTHIGTWTCNATMTQGTHTVFAKAYIGANPSTVVSGNRIFYLFEESVGDTDGDGILNENDNDPGTPITEPVISTLENTSGTTYTISGTGDATTMPAVQTRVGVMAVGNSTPLFYANVDAAGNWTGSYEFALGSYTLYARAYVGTYASNVDSEQVLLDVQSALFAVPTPRSLPVYTGANDVSFSWDSSAEGGQFYAQVATDADFTSVVNSSGWINETTHEFQNLNDGTKYYFRVKLRNTSGTETAYSSTVFTTIDLYAPSTGSVSNSTGSYSSSASITFTWSNFSDATSGIDHYEVDIASNANFSTIVFSDTHYTGTTKTFSGVSGNTYFARVRAVDGVSKKSSFAYSAGTTVDTTAPSAFTLHTYTDPAPTGDKIITWDTSIDTESGILQYDVQREDTGYDTNGDPVSEAALRSIGTTTNVSFTDTTTQANKKYLYKVIASNRAGGTTTSNNIQFFVRSDQAHPPLWENFSNYSTTDSVVLDWIAATDIDVAAYEVFRDDTLITTIGSASTTTYTDADAKTDGRIYRYRVHAKNAQGSAGGDSDIISVLVDKSLPVTSYVVSGTPNGAGWYRSPVTVTLTGTDPGTRLFDPNTSQGVGFYSGVRQTLYNKNSAGLTPYTSQISFGTNGTNTLSFYATDFAGNAETAQNIQVKVDAELPTALFSTNLNVNAQNGFVTANSASFTSQGTDTVSGVASVTTYARFDQNGDGTLSGTNDFDFTQVSTSATSPDTGTYTFTRDGQYDFKVVTIDNAGNSTTSSIVTIKVDRAAPVTTDNGPMTVPPTQPFTITLTPSDAPVSSGLSQTYYTTDGTTPTTSSSTGTSISSTNITFTGNYYTVKYFSVDSLGNTETVKTRTNNPTDTDSDGMPDSFESSYTTPSSTTSLTPAGNTDVDGLTNLQEYQNSTNPLVADTDGDTITDGTEVTDGTDPGSANDHRPILIAPRTTAQTTDTPFVFLVKAPVEKVVFVKNSSGTIIGSGTADASGRAFIELSLAVGANHTLSAEFLHEDGQVVKTTSISVDVAQGTLKNPKFSNVDDGEFLLQGFIDLEVDGKANANMELFTISNNNMVSLSEGTSDGSGNITFTLPNTFVLGQIFIIDHTNLLTSEIISMSRGVRVTGQVLDTAGTPIETVNVKFINGNTEYPTVTDANGEYTLNVIRDTTYTVKIYHQSYLKYEAAIAVTDEDVRVSPSLALITTLNQTQTESGLIQIDSSGKAETIRQAGFSRYEILKNADLGYEAAVEQAQELNKGIEKQIITRINAFGQEEFLGYVPGRKAAEDFEMQPSVARKITGLLVSERRGNGTEEGLLTSATKEAVCLTPSDTVVAVVDVPVHYRYAEDITKAHTYGVLIPGENKKFRPEETISWQDIFQSILAANCVPLENFATLQNEKFPILPDMPLENTLESILFYTALKQGIIDFNFNPEKSPTRASIFPILSRAFELEINEKAKNTSYDDVLENDSLAPVLVSARLAGWLKNFPEERFFYHNKEITRAEFTSLFVNALEFKKSNITQGKLFEKLMKKLRGTEEEKNARLGTRETSTTDVNTILRAREYYEKEKKQRFYYPTRGSWNPLDPNTERAPITTEPTGSIRQSDRPAVLRDLDKADKINNAR